MLLESVAPTFVYYAGSTATGTPLAAAPIIVGTYTAVANFAGSADYAASYLGSGHLQHQPGHTHADIHHMSAASSTAVR